MSKKTLVVKEEDALIRELRKKKTKKRISNSQS